MHSLEPKFLESLTFSPEVVSTLRRLGEYQGKQELYFQQTPPRTLQSLQKAAIIESSESSNRLEGATAPRKRIEQIVLQSIQPTNRSEQEIAGYRDALGLLHGSAVNMEFSTHGVSQCHSILYRYPPQPGGDWKSTDNYIVEGNPDGSIRRIRFTPVSAVQTPQAMEALVRNFHQAIDQNGHEPLIVIPLAILDFLCIHPFSDGNGRMARLITLLLLYRFNYQVGRYISLERIFEESQATYYESLERSSRDWHQGKHDIFPWASYFWSVLLRAYEEFESRVGKLRRGKGAKTAQIQEVVSTRIHPFAISDIESDCPEISRDMIRLVLRQLRDEGSIRLQGKGRGAKWLNTSGKTAE
jgi:Fic family protein